MIGPTSGEAWAAAARSRASRVNAVTSTMRSTILTESTMRASPSSASASRPSRNAMLLALAVSDCLRSWNARRRSRRSVATCPAYPEIAARFTDITSFLGVPKNSKLTLNVAVLACHWMYPFHEIQFREKMSRKLLHFWRNMSLKFTALTRTARSSCERRCVAMR